MYTRKCNWFAHFHSLRRHYPDQVVMGMISARDYRAPLFSERTKIHLFCLIVFPRGVFHDCF
jgi:hypothetical protein